MATWYSAGYGYTPFLWPDAPVEDVVLLGMLLEVAKDQVVQFAPRADEVDEGGPAYWDADGNPCDRLVYAQLQQAKNLYNAGRVVGSDGTSGAEGFTFVPRPLDKTIQGIIRPRSGGGSVL